MHKRPAGFRLLSFQREHLRDARHDRITSVDPATLTGRAFARPTHLEGPQYGRGLALIIAATVVALLAWAALSPSLDQVLPQSAEVAQVGR